jgi:hypothetical protein
VTTFAIIFAFAIHASDRDLERAQIRLRNAILAVERKQYDKKLPVVGQIVTWTEHLPTATQANAKSFDAIIVDIEPYGTSIPIGQYVSISVEGKGAVIAKWLDLGDKDNRDARDGYCKPLE